MKYDNCLHFFKVSFKETRPLQNMKTAKKKLGFFKDTQSNFVFLFEVLEFSIFGFLCIVMEKVRLTLHAAAFPYIFTHLFKLYSSMAMVSG